MAKDNNLSDFLEDLADAIREKEGSNELINPQDFSARIRAISAGGWTGHADVEGLKAIGWSDDDIAHYQKYGVNWDAEEDQYHLVSDDNKALYGVLTADNISTNATRIVYLPYIELGGRTSTAALFKNCYVMVATPRLNTHDVEDMSEMYYGCYSLVCQPRLDTSNATTMRSMFYGCYSLTEVHELYTQCVEDMSYMFYNCHSLRKITTLYMANVTTMAHMCRNCYSLIDIALSTTHNVEDTTSAFNNCYSLVNITELDVYSVTTSTNMFTYCYSLLVANLRNVKTTFSFVHSRLLKKESLLYIINNEAATSAITIKLQTNSYADATKDADILAALANHPNVSLAK